MPSFLYNLTLTPLKNFGSTLSGIKECLENDRDAAGRSQDSNAALNDQKGKNKRFVKQLSTIEEAVDDDDEPKTYEVREEVNGVQGGFKPAKRTRGKTYEVAPDDLD